MVRGPRLRRHRSSRGARQLAVSKTVSIVRRQLMLTCLTRCTRCSRTPQNRCPCLRHTITALPPQQQQPVCAFHWLPTLGACPAISASPVLGGRCLQPDLTKLSRRRAPYKIRQSGGGQCAHKRLHTTYAHNVHCLGTVGFDAREPLNARPPFLPSNLPKTILARLAHADRTSANVSIHSHSAIQ